MGKITRAEFLKRVAVAGGVAAGGSLFANTALASSHPTGDYSKFSGILFDATKCIGCRTCEKACNLVNKLVEPGQGPAANEFPFDDTEKAFEKRRRTGYSSHTVINRFYPSGSEKPEEKKPVYIKYQCMHCNRPVCVSACIVGALKKEPEGPIHYKQSDCIGCRYCVVACPFQIPVYEYFDALTPGVLKCTLCEPRTKQGLLPGCVKACPMETMTYGKREELLDLGHSLIKKFPEKYHPEIYGEQVIGGTGWMYLMPKGINDAETLGMPLFKGMTEPIPPITEEIQHTRCKYFIPPVLFYGTLAGILFYNEKHPKPLPKDMPQGGEEHE